MKWLTRSLPTLWEVALLITGFGILWAEVAVWAILGRTPDGTLSAIGGGCLIPAARTSVRMVLGSGGTGSSSELSSPPSSPSPPSSAPPEGGRGEQHG